MITASIVLYNTDITQLRGAISSYAPSDERILYLVDNSEQEFDLKKLDMDLTYIRYIFNNKNLGYGQGHNIAIHEAFRLNSIYHLVMNSDLLFDPSIIETIILYMDKNKDIGQLMPKITDQKGNICYLCKLVPTPFDLLLRRFLPFANLKQSQMDKFQLKFTNYDKIMNVPYLSGCFMFFRVSALKTVGLFDERFFMYPEDIDITRRMHRNYKTIYYPYISIIHFYGGASYKSLKMLWIHTYNMIKYFNKWGWFFDTERRKINARVLADLNFSGERKI
jgi:glycosyltransferase, family 2